MPRHFANVFDPASIQALYPFKLWAAEAGMNSSARTTVLRGLAILSRPDATGAFEIARATRPFGKLGSDHNSVFHCPYMGKEYNAFTPAPGVHGAVVETPNAAVDRRAEYDGFIAEVIEKARQADLRTASK